ncbi:hypothetical protein C0995_013752 [Termitomyces sp. Mi166|nr:hypothetical protein C0995_013752 [Termitomyces sp. Mi166\
MAPRLHFKHALRSAARITRISPTEPPLVYLRVQVLGCSALAAGDRNGLSDPFVVVSLLGNRHQTPVAKRTVSPSYTPRDATWDFAIHLAAAPGLGAVEIVVWDKDTLGKDYLGEAAIPLGEWFAEGRGWGWEDVSNKPFTVNLESTRVGTSVSGSVHIKLGFVKPANDLEFDVIYAQLLKLSRLSLVSAPPTEGVGTISSSSVLEDDGGLSSDEAESDSDSDDDEFTDAYEELPMTTPPPLQIPTSTPAPQLTIQPSSPVPTTKAPSASFVKKLSVPIRRLSGLGSSSGNTSPTDPATLTPTPGEDAGPQDAGAKKGRFFGTRKSAPPTPGAETVVSDPFVGVDVDGKAGKKKKGKKKKEKGEGGAYAYDAGDNDILGIVMLEVVKAEDLPRLKNMTRTSFDMDPFVVISFGKKVFRTRVVRHSLNPTWDEKLLFHVRRYETKWRVQLRVHDWDKMSSNDFVGEGGFYVQELIDKAPQKNPTTGLYDSSAFESGSGEQDMIEFKLRLEGESGKEPPEWEGRHQPVVYIRAKYQPYSLLRHRFWRHYLAQYDTDDTNTISRLELTSLLDSLGSTLTRETVQGFWEERGKSVSVDELSVEEAIGSLEGVLGRPMGERRRVGVGEAETGSTGETGSASAGEGAVGLDLSKMDFGPGVVEGGSYSSSSAYSSDDAGEGVLVPSAGAGAGAGAGMGVSASAQSSALMPPKTQQQVSLSVQPHTKKRSRFRRKPAQTQTPGLTPPSSSPSSPPDDRDAFAVERVINVKSCPICHRPRMSSKAEVDIITHMAVCASTDWGRVDRIVVGEYVTPSQAQRKWYTKIINKVGGGEYKLGAGATSRMEGGRARKLLKSLSFKQGVKYDSPQSAAEIPAFIEFHGLKVDEILDPLDSFKTFNEFFYRYIYVPLLLLLTISNTHTPPRRKLKPSARPLDSPEDPYRLVSAADCRLMTFSTIDDATRLWIKGREFSISKLLGEAYAAEAERYKDGALVIFRLAPQDYHRFHSPVDGRVGTMSVIAGEYYTVNPQAIRSSLDVYGENVRKIVPIDSPQFGRVMAVCVGAMMVGSIKTTVQEGDYVRRGDEFGYFAFGGSTIVILFEKDRVEWDEDLLKNGRASLETLVRVRSGIGRGRQPPAGAVAVAV